MGIYDRNYAREDRPNDWLSNRPMVVNLVLLNVAVYVVELIWEGSIVQTCGLSGDLFQAPWNAWQLLTYGFLHDPGDLRHILFNMFGLWFFGRDLESIYGRAELVRIYLATLIVSGLIWAAWVSLFPSPDPFGVPRLIGASGGVMGLMILYVLHFPRRVLYLFGVIPLPGWALGVIYVVFDLANLGSSDNVAHVAHLAGVAFGAAYFQSGLNFGRLLPRRLSQIKLRLGPRLRIHEPEAEDQRDLGQQVDAILEKISREGEASLTKKERSTLEEASRRYQRRRE